MAQTKPCSKCGNPVPGEAPEGLCPACLLRAGVAATTAGYGAAASAAAWPTPDLATLQGLFPELEILELIGRGGMGAVFKARQRNLDRPVALKVLPPELGPAFTDRFTREAQSLAKLNHPHIVAIYDFGDRNGQFFFLMEYVDGVNLRQLMQAGTLTPHDTLAIVPQICEALQFAHDHGIVHRDIKPENVLLNKTGQVKIADFGLARLIGFNPDLTVSQVVVGTPVYMAPEQLERPAEVDHRADIYSLGVVFYQLLTGELPLGRFDPPSQRVKVDVRLDEVVLRTLEKQPERRYQQASEVRSQVQGIAAGPTPPPPPPPPPAPQASHKPAPSFSFPAALADTRIPAIGLIVSACLGLLSALIVLGGLSTSLNGSYAFGSTSGWAQMHGLIVLISVGGLLLNLLVLFGSIRMLQRRSYALALTAAIAAIIGSPGQIIGLAFGIWALVVLSRPEMKESFARNDAIRRENRIPFRPDARLSRTALLGTGWLGLLAFSFLALVAVRVETTSAPPSGPGILGYAGIALAVMGLLAPVITPVCGLVGIRQIRAADGGLYGLGLAAF